jgi:hypothetical protein
VLFDHDPFTYPTLSTGLQAFARGAYGALLLLTLAAALPQARRYFQSERWGGYAQSSRWVDAVQNPYVGPVLLVVWFASALGLMAGKLVLLSAAVNLLFCHYMFIRMRWRAVLRGMGAPGFIAFWLGAAVFLLELTTRHAPGLRGLALLTVQVDFALIMISAGLYKLVSGYRAGFGMQLGMVNPQWGYWPAFWRGWPPRHQLFRVLNEMAWSTEVFAGVLMLVPPTRMLGAVAILLSFVFIATQIRLGFLCEMIVVCCLLFVPAGGAVDRTLGQILPNGQAANQAGAPLPDVVYAALAASCWLYMLLLPLVRAAMFYNQLAHKALPARLQSALDRYTNLTGLIIWRVFTADIVNFFIRVWVQPSRGGVRRLVSDYEGLTWTHRYRQVAECITLTSVFTTLRYYPSRREIFTDRLIRYARTIPHEPDAQPVFEWVGIAIRPDRFAFVPVAEFIVDVDVARVTETILGDATDVHGVPGFSPLHESARPGSYAPLIHPGVHDQIKSQV